jgi:hypothetical protein
VLHVSIPSCTPNIGIFVLLVNPLPKKIIPNDLNDLATKNFHKLFSAGPLRREEEVICPVWKKRKDR